jgi:hypothetical protein
MTRPRVPTALLVLLVMCFGCAPSGTRPIESTARAPQGVAKADDLLVVDCLLPGQIRQLGGRVTYVTARRAVKTSARDCEIRGGEYVAFDRANYATALKVWLPLAKDGDATAQSYVGEIFEKGLGVPPDYAAAAEWYRRAADGGSSRAAINLGALYEQGLGVPKDVGQALNWYRRAAGMSDVTFNAVAPSSSDEGAQLRREVTELRRQLQAKQAALEQTQRELENLRRNLEQRRSEIDAERAAVARLRADLERQRTMAQGSDNTRIRELEKSITERESQIAGKDRELAKLRTDVVRLESESATHRTEVDRLRQKELDAGPEIQIIEPQLVVATRDTVATRDIHPTPARAQAPASAQPPASPQAPASAPAAASPQMAANADRVTGDRVVFATSDRVTVIGRVVATAGLSSFTVNGREEKVDNTNIFRTQIAVKKPQERVRIVAVDRSGRKAAVDFVVIDRTPPPQVASAPSPNVAPTAPVIGIPLPKRRVNFGNYHALVIGINDYKFLKPLRTAVNDAKEVGRILEKDYGFRVTLLLNPTRYDLLSKLNDFRERLTEKDNLLIYYAGHGELDQRNQRGHWLPVDAEPTSSANWVSNITITDVLNVMNVQQLLVIADSCYAGTITRSALGQLDGGMSDEKKIETLQLMVQKRSRVAMTSGGVEPVIDSAGGTHSVFAVTFMELLQGNAGVLTGQEMFHLVRLRVAATAEKVEMHQVPEYGPIKFAGHESGDFLFVRRAN